jgi:hypothetical protein
MSDSKIKIPQELLEKAEKYAEAASYSSVEDFIISVLEKELVKLEESESEELIKERLKDLGYIS